jgi:hypothetical protein
MQGTSSLGVIFYAEMVFFVRYSAVFVTQKKVFVMKKKVFVTKKKVFVTDFFFHFFKITNKFKVPRIVQA